MHLSGEEATIINVAAGAALTWVGSMWGQRRSRRDARVVRRREAYTTLIMAIDHLDRTWNHPETLEDEFTSKKMGEVTAQAVREIHRGSVLILLGGSKKAKQSARKVRDTAWAFNDFINGPSKNKLVSQELGRLSADFTEAGREFIKLAEDELSD